MSLLISGQFALAQFAAVMDHQQTDLSKPGGLLSDFREHFLHFQHDRGQPGGLPFKETGP